MIFWLCFWLVRKYTIVYHSTISLLIQNCICMSTNMQFISFEKIQLWQLHQVNKIKSTTEPEQNIDNLIQSWTNVANIEANLQCTILIFDKLELPTCLGWTIVLIKPVARHESNDSCPFFKTYFILPYCDCMLSIFSIFCTKFPNHGTYAINYTCAVDYILNLIDPQIKCKIQAHFLQGFY